MFKSVYQLTAVHKYYGPGSCHHGTYISMTSQGPAAAGLISYVSMKPVAHSGFTFHTWDMFWGESCLQWCIVSRTIAPIRMQIRKD